MSFTSSPERAAAEAVGHGEVPALIDRGALAAAVDDFCATVTGDFAVEDILRQLAQAVVRVLDIDGAGVVIHRGGQLLRFVFATEGPVTELERLQELLQDGPCRDSQSLEQTINIADLAVEGSWPQYQDRASELGLSAVTAIPLRARGQSWGVLDMYRLRAQRLSSEELAAAQTLANLATSYMVVTADRDAARHAQDELAQRAMHDPLTGLPVRWVFLEQVAHALTRLTRRPGHLAVLFIDLDGLKYVNDTYGHLAGDRLISASVRRVHAAVRPSDIVARIGGDEFVVLLEEVNGVEDAAGIAQRIVDELAAPYRPDGEVLQPSASIGVAVTADPHQTPDTLIAHADAAMYVAKHTGRGRFEIFDEDRYATDRAATLARDQLSAQLRAGIASGQVEVHYQPILALADEPSGAQGPGVYAVEALARWRHPSRGLLAAAEFIPAAERAGLLTELDSWVLDEACRQLATWDRRLGPGSPQRVFVNISAAEMAGSDLAARAGAALGKAGLTGGRLTIEVTETGLFTNPHAADVTIKALRELGCHLAIDDFGAGYSSLSRLEQVPAAVLKIDGSFARDLHTSAVAAAVVSAVLVLGRSLGLTVIAEGVEDSA
ncbi:MAG TPA: EAL domain-containing protein, partial [Actinomycetales bacterium]